MGTAAYGENGPKERAWVSGERPVGAASFRQQCIQASHQPGFRLGYSALRVSSATTATVGSS